MVLLGYPRPSLAGIGVPWVLTGTHRCALMPKVASRQSACTLWLVQSRSHVLWELRILTLLLDWKRCSKALSVIV